MELNKIDINDIKALLEAYNIPDFDMPDKLNPYFIGKLSKRLALILDSGMKAYAHFDNNCEELALLIQFLRTCKGSDIEFKGIITSPKGKQVKGTEMKTTISSQYFLTWLELFVNTWLERQQDGLYQYEFNWNFKEPLTSRKGLAPLYEEEQDPFFTDPYTDEEITTIIEYYSKAKKAFPKFSKNGELGRMAWKIKSILEQHKLDIKQVKLYSFIYDLMLLGEHTGKESIIDEGFSGDIGKEKSQYIRNWLAAHERDVEKHKKRQT